MTWPQNKPLERCIVPITMTKQENYAMKYSMSALIVSTLMMAGCGGSGGSTAQGDISGGEEQATGVFASNNITGPQTQALVLPEAGQATGSETAKLRVLLTDAPNPAIESAIVTIDEISVHAAGDAPFSIMSEPRTLDLLDYQNGLTTLMGELDLPAGKYTQLRLSVSEGAVVSEGIEYSLSVPSGSVKINRPFDVCAGGVVDLVFDFDALRSLYYNQGRNEFKLQPVIKIASVESVCPEEGTTGNVEDENNEYTGATGWLSFVLPPVEVAMFDSLTTQLDDVRVHDQGLGQVSVLSESYDIDLLQPERQLVNDLTGVVEQTVLLPAFEVPVGSLDQVRLLLQAIVATDAEGRSISFELPEEVELEEDGLKFFDEVNVCENTLTIVRWDYNFDSTEINFETSPEIITIHPVVQSVNVVEECVPFE